MEITTEQSTPQRTKWSGQMGDAAGALLRRRTRKQRYQEERDPPQRRARALGWFSLGLGVAQLLAPGGLARLTLGSARRRTRDAMFALGVRELACGIGILGRPRSAGWLWARVAGDLMDLAMLGSALTSRKTDRARVLGSMGAVLGVTALDAFTGVQLSRERMGLRADRAMRVTRAITVQRPIDEVYRFWRDFKNLPRFMAHLVTVHVRDEKTSHWVASGPAGTTVEWDAEIVADRPNEMIAWRSLDGADVSNSGTVRFTRAPGGQATEIHLELHYDPPAGRLGVSIAKLFGKEPGQQVKGDLHRFKQVLEIGEVVHSDASIHRRPHPARPAGERAGSYRREGGRR